jgi:alpha-glucosidase (family GH31 glycosyl hydrolase)
MFGSELLVAPIFNVWGERSIYLPEGRWVDYWTHEVISGPRTLHVQVPLDILPLYVRANALIPTTEPTTFTSAEPFNTISVDAYLFERGSFALYDTDGLTHITAELRDSQLDVTLEGVKQQLILRLLPLPGKPPVATVSVNETRYLEALSREGLEHFHTWVHTPDGTILVYINA